MNKALITRLIEAIDAIIEDNGTWKEKRDQILADLNEAEKGSLSEFCAWFEENEDE